MCAARSDSPKDMETARTLAEALPYMRAFAGQTVVVKFGGHAMGDGALAQTFAQDIVLLKQVGINPVVVHGGGPQIADMLERLGIKTDFVDGLRVTDRKTVDRGRDGSLRLDQQTDCLVDQRRRRHRRRIVRQGRLADRGA